MLSTADYHCLLPFLQSSDSKLWSPVIASSLISSINHISDRFVYSRYFYFDSLKQSFQHGPRDYSCTCFHEGAHLWQVHITDVAARLEEVLFKKSFIEDYWNLETLMSRGRALVRIRQELRSSQRSAISSGVQTRGLPNQGGPASMQNGLDVGSSSNLFNVDSELLHARDFIREHILASILERKTEPVSDVDKMKWKECIKLFEDALFKKALTNNYNVGTFTSHLEALMRRGLIRFEAPRNKQPANLLRKRTTALPGRDI